MGVIEYQRGGNLAITQNFNQKELACKGKNCGCKKQLINTKLVRKLQVLRMILGEPIYINSAYRCAAHNRAVGGANGSYHTRGMAVDIRCNSVSSAELAKLAQSIGFTGIGCYTAGAGNFVHADVRGKEYFWNNSGSGNKKSGGFGGKRTICPYKDGGETLKNGSRGESVKALQWALSICVPDCKVDGIFGEKTKAALIEFQTAMLLEADGIRGAKTRAAMKEAFE